MKVWSVKQLNKELALAISKQYDLPIFLSMMLDIRGLTTQEEIQDFLSNEGNFSNPFLMKDMDKAVSRITNAIENGEIGRAHV